MFHGGFIACIPWSILKEENPSVALRYGQWCCFVCEVLLVLDHNTMGDLLNQHSKCAILHMASVGSREGETDPYTR